MSEEVRQVEDWLEGLRKLTGEVKKTEAIENKGDRGHTQSQIYGLPRRIPEIRSKIIGQVMIDHMCIHRSYTLYTDYR